MLEYNSSGAAIRSSGAHRCRGGGLRDTGAGAYMWAAAGHAPAATVEGKVLHDEKVSTFRQWLKGVKVFGVEAVDYFASLSVLLLLLSTRWEEALSF